MEMFMSDWYMVCLDVSGGEVRTGQVRSQFRSKKDISSKESSSQDRLS